MRLFAVFSTNDKSRFVLCTSSRLEENNKLFFSQSLSVYYYLRVASAYIVGKLESVWIVEMLSMNKYNGIRAVLAILKVARLH
jgi:hypothetical protein